MVQDGDRQISYPASRGDRDRSLNATRKLGLEDEAVASAWAEFCEHPRTYSYFGLMKFVPRRDRPAWHEKAIEAASARADLHSLIGLLAETKETGRLAYLVGHSSDSELEQVSHYALEPAARMLEKAHAGSAARLWRAMGMRIVNSGKQAALQNFERARRCYAEAGLEADWEQVVSQVRAGHHRKTGFMRGLEEAVTGSGCSQDPPFLERAKARWAARPTRDEASIKAPGRIAILSALAFRRAAQRKQQ